MKNRVKHIHFIGIGGIGMSGIAEVLHGLGFIVSGSDMTESTTSRRLVDQGIRVFYSHNATHIHGADVIVTSSAVPADNPEVQEARAQKVPVIPRALMLVELMRFKQGITIAGTHGKTTTTSLTASVLGASGLDPTFVIGGRLTAAGSNARLGSGEFLVAEADESDASFLHLTPVMAVVTNIDTDHMGTYDHSLDKLKQAFVDFLQRLPFYGRAVLCQDDPNVRDICGRITKPVTTYGLDDTSDIYAENIRAVDCQMHFDVTVNSANKQHFPVVLNMPGRHNVLNALAAIAIALECGATMDAIQTGLSEFVGVGRRFQHHGEIRAKDGGSFTLVDDYGHHPVEIAATLAAAKAAFPNKRLVLAFQPHRYTRTRDLFEDFVKVLCGVDILLLSEVYAAGEAPIDSADGRSLARAIRAQSKLQLVFVEDIDEMPHLILDQAHDGDVVITMGAGSISAVPAKVAVHT